MARLFKMRIIAFVLLFAGLNSVTAFGQSNKFITLKDAVEMCMQNNKQLKVNKLRVDAAIAATKEAKDKRLPDASASASYIRLTKPTLDGPMLRNAPSFNINQATIASVNGSVPLFAGFKVKNGIESAKYLEQATKLDAESDKVAIIQNTIEAYSNLYKALSTINVIKENLKQAEQQTIDFQNLEKKGMLARNDLLKAKVHQSNIQVALMDAESDWKMANLNMNIMLGLPDETQLQLDSTSFNEIAETKAFGEYEQSAVSNRHDVESLKYQEKSAEAGVKIAKGDYYPALKLTGGYFAANIPNLMTITNAWNAGLGISYNISSLWKTKSKVNSAKIQLEQIKANEEILIDKVKLEVAQAYENYQLSKKKIEVYAQALEQTEENNKITKNKYRNNLVTTTDLLDAEVQNIQTKLNYENSKADAVVAYNKLLQVSGFINNQSK